MKYKKYLITIVITIIILAGALFLFFREFEARFPTRFTDKKECETKTKDRCFYFDCRSEDIELSSDTLFGVLCKKRFGKKNAWHGHKQARNACLEWCDDTYGVPTSSGLNEGGISFVEDCILGCITPLDIQ